MNPQMLLKNWPQWRNAGADTILASPALAIPLNYAGTQDFLRPLDQILTDTLDLKVRFDGEDCVISLADSEDFPDLHLLWKQRSILPKELLLAILENECGKLLQALENMAEAELNVVGMFTDLRPEQKFFQIGNVKLGLELPLNLKMVMARLSNLDHEHESIRTMTRGANVLYATFNLNDQELASLAENDRLLLQDDFLEKAYWIEETPDEIPLCLCSAEPEQISFEDYVNDNLPTITANKNLTLYANGKIVADGVFDTLGEKKCFRLTHLH